MHNRLLNSLFMPLLACQTLFPTTAESKSATGTGTLTEPVGNQWFGKWDPSSFSNPDDLRTQSLTFHWKLDFSKRIVTGSVIHEFAVLNSDAKQLILDSRDVNVTKVIVLKSGRELPFSIGETVLTFGEPLIIELGELARATGRGNKIEIEIQYSTSEECTALQWLNPQQTAGKRHPYVFSQCEAIHARSLFPCQDTPGVKATYSAVVSVPKELQALMSAVPIGEPEVDGSNKIFKFEQKIPIPSYLTAIAVGDIVGKKIGPRSTVWAEPEVVEKAAYEFAETEKMLVTAEDLVGEYVWGRYDILVLPPSFPYGGMENPCLTFATPTLLAGDRSLANVIAHEIAHSWTGNLVTNRNWEHFWLNEGFTNFVERKILGVMKGEEYRQFESIGGWNDLVDGIKHMKEDDPLTRLVVDLNGTGTDPDEAFSKVPYEKGYAFLYYLEEKVGGPAVFEPFLAHYIKKNSGKSIDTNVFITDFKNYFKTLGLTAMIGDIDWDGWLYTPGMPLVKPEYDQTLAKAVTNLKNRWIEWNPATPSPFNKSDMDSLFPAQIEQFLQEFLLDENESLSLAKFKEMEKFYEMSSRKNAEIHFRWIRLGIKLRDNTIIPIALDFVNEQGRMKYVRPIYRDLYAWEEVRPVAIQNYLENSDRMMYVLARLLLQDLHIKP